VITVTGDYKTTVKGDYKDIRATVSDGANTITESDDLKSIKVYNNGGLCRTIMKQAEVRHWGTYDWLDTWLEINIGVDVGGTPEYVNHGEFKVVKVTEDQASGEKILKLYDRMYEALQEYDDTAFTYPLTILQLLQAICTELGWTLNTTTFTHSTLSIATDLFSDQGLRYRDILEDIAEATGTIMYFNEDSELTLKAVDTSTIAETLTTNEEMNLTLETKWGELNSLALARDPQEDVILQQDATSIAANGLWEFRISNNLILDGDRETYIGDLFTALNGIEYYPFECETIGLGYFEVGDTIQVTDTSSNTYPVLITDIEIDLSGGLKETLKGVSPAKASTDYDTAGIIGKTIRDTQIIVNKQDGEIEILNEAMETVATIPRQSTEPASPETNDLWLNLTDNIIYIYNGEEWIATAIKIEDLDNYYTINEVDTAITTSAETITLAVESVESLVNDNTEDIATNTDNIEDTQSNVTQLELDVDGLELEVSGVGGSNLLKNSAGLKGSLEEWQDLDANGDPVGTDNDGTIVQTSNVEENTESGSAIRIDEQFITQTFSTIAGGTYTFYCRFNKLEDLDLTISGVVGTLEITAGDYVDETWAVYQYQFTAVGSNTTITISNTGSLPGAYAILSDMVCKLGVVTGWVQAPNEVYGNNYRFDEDGFSVTSLTDQFKAVLDNVKLGIYDTSSGTDRIMALFSKDAGLITSLVAQDELVIQRYENSDSSTRFIPTSTGCMITVNDS
jgi:hypothetical protein